MNDHQGGAGGNGGGPGQDATPRLVVGLGASAGGIKALQEFFVGCRRTAAPPSWSCFISLPSTKAISPKCCRL